MFQLAYITEYSALDPSSRIIKRERAENAFEVVLGVLDEAGIVFPFEYAVTGAAWVLHTYVFSLFIHIAQIKVRLVLLQVLKSFDALGRAGARRTMGAPQGSQARPKRFGRPGHGRLPGNGHSEAHLNEINDWAGHNRGTDGAQRALTVPE